MGATPEPIFLAFESIQYLLLKFDELKPKDYVGIHSRSSSNSGSNCICRILLVRQVLQKSIQ